MGINPSCWRKEDGNKSVNESFEISWRIIETKTRLETPRISGYKGNIVPGSAFDKDEYVSKVVTWNEVVSCDSSSFP